MIPIPEKRVADFEAMGFGMFVHFGLYSRLGMGEDIESVCWMDNGEELEFGRDGSKFSLYATGYTYGSSTCVRVAKAKLKG